MPEDSKPPQRSAAEYRSARSVVAHQLREVADMIDTEAMELVDIAIKTDPTYLTTTVSYGEIPGL